jgi:hypothetical protein
MTFLDCFHIRFENYKVCLDFTIIIINGKSEIRSFSLSFAQYLILYIL